MAQQDRSVRNPLVLLHELGRAARRAESLRELEFFAVNDTRSLLPYRQGVLWFDQGGVRSLSGVVKIEANAPYVQWLNRVCSLLSQQDKGSRLISETDMPEDLQEAWSDWLPAHAAWIPFKQGDAKGGLLLARDLPWTETQLAVLSEWIEIWS